MTFALDKRWMLIGLAVVVLVIQISYPEQWTIVWLPAVFTAIVLLLYRNELRRFDWNMMRKKTFWEAVFFAVTQGMIAQAAGIVILQYGLHVQPIELAFDVTIGVAFSVVICSAILEELVYRKSVFGWLKTKIQFWPAAVVSSLLFAAAHANYAAALGYFLLGLVWCRSYEKSGTIAVPIAAHMIFNAISLIVIPLRG